MRSKLLRSIYYVTKDNFVTIPQTLSDELAKHGIKIYQVPLASIDRFLPPKNATITSCLILSDVPELVQAFLDNGYYVVAVHNFNNKGASFPHVPFAVEDFTEIDWHYFIRFWQRYAGIPWHILSTERCKVREMCPEDLNGIYDLYSDKRICQYTEDLFENRIQELNYIKDYVSNAYGYYGYGTWLIEDAFTGKLIGRAGFNHRPGFDDPEIGFVIKPTYWRHGLAYEVCQAILKYGKEEHGFSRTHAFVRIENEASIKLLEKLGFRACGRYTINDIMHERYVLEY